MNEPIKGKPVPQDTDPHAPGYYAPYNDMGLVRTINNAVDCGWKYPSEEERKVMDKLDRNELGKEIGVDVAKWDEIHK